MSRVHSQKPAPGAGTRFCRCRSVGVRCRIFTIHPVRVEDCTGQGVGIDFERLGMFITVEICSWCLHSLP